MILDSLAAEHFMKKCYERGLTIIDNALYLERRTKRMSGDVTLALDFVCALKKGEMLYKKELSEFNYKEIYRLKNIEEFDYEHVDARLEWLVHYIAEFFWTDEDDGRFLNLIKAFYVTLDARKYFLDYKKAFLDLGIL